jgi:hypothetical protein
LETAAREMEGFVDFVAEGDSSLFRLRSFLFDSILATVADKNCIFSLVVGVSYEPSQEASVNSVWN